MSPRRRLLAALITLLALGTMAAAPVRAQGNSKAKHYAVSSDRAMTVTRTVLERQGFEVVRVVRSEDAQVVYYRAGNHGRGKGKGPIERMVIRTVERRVVFEDTPPAVLVDIDLNLKL
ncbi:MAG TPA: hypothetical protein VM387_06290 [Gemmatimonadales bacterium]|jgi:hypothetical protein|nr:hypothetical protein [Gemmatimonadales bacterium]